MEYASRGVANTGLGLGIAGTALGIMGGGASLLGLMPNCNRSGDDTYVTRHELQQAQIIAAKDSEIALLKSEQNTEVKIADVYERVMTKVNANKDMQDAINRDQAVYNATNTATVSVLGNQVNDLRAVLNCITAIHIPANVVCPEPMPAKNSWTAPTT